MTRAPSAVDAGALPSHRHHRSAGEQRGEIKLHSIDEAGIKGLPQHFPTAFDQNTGDLPPTKIGQYLRERFSLDKPESARQNDR